MLEFLEEFGTPADKAAPHGFELAVNSTSSLLQASFPWTQDIPWPVLLNDLLPLGSLGEERDLFRFGTEAQNYFRGLVQDLHSVERLEGGAAPSRSDIAVKMNRDAWKITSPPIAFVPSPPDQINSYAPSETVSRKSTSCTGAAVFLVQALRCVGVPARVAGTPHWNMNAPGKEEEGGKKACPEGDESAECGNHNWVEFFDEDSNWSFLDPLGDLRPNHGWFHPSHTSHQLPGSTAHSIYAASFAPPLRLSRMGYPPSPSVFSAFSGFFPLVFAPEDRSVRAWDVTGAYVDKPFGRGEREEEEVRVLM